MDLKGILPVLPTPYAVDGQVDPAAMRRVVRFALSAGVNGVVYPGFASEVGELSLEERGEMLRAVVEEIDDAATVIAGGTAETIKAVVRCGRQAGDLGIRLMMIQPPLSLGGSAESVVSFMKSVAEALPGMKFVFQNAPAPRGSDIPPEAIACIVEQVPEIAYVKEETLPPGPAVRKILENRPPSLKGVIGGGGARMILEEYANGACAAMPAVEIADVHAALDKAWRSGRKDEAKRIFDRTVPLLSLQAMYRMRLTKHVLVRRGVLRNSIVRSNLIELDAGGTRQIDLNLEDLGIVADSDGRQADAA